MDCKVALTTNNTGDGKKRSL